MQGKLDLLLEKAKVEISKLERSGVDVCCVLYFSIDLVYDVKCNFSIESDEILLFELKRNIRIFKGDTSRSIFALKFFEVCFEECDALGIVGEVVIFVR